MLFVLGRLPDRSTTVVSYRRTYRTEQVEGQVIGRIHSPEEPSLDALTITAPFAGYLNAARAITPTRPGDVVAVVAKGVTMAELLEG
jgi:predicted deacylase